MRRIWVVAIEALAVLTAGCLSGRSSRDPGLLNRINPFHGPAGGDVLALEIALLEAPAGDRYLCEDLWRDVDEQLLDESRARLEDNGLRIGQVGGLTPKGLQELLISERSNRNARRVQLRAGSATTVNLGALRPKLDYAVRLDGKTDAATFEQAQCSMRVTPSLEAEGRIRLKIEPQVQHGEKRRWPQMAAGLGLPVQDKPVEAYPKLGFAIDLGLNEYAVVGAHFDGADTLGRQFFVAVEGDRVVQRLLAIRAYRLARGPGSLEPGDTDAAVPLAAQAASTTARGSSR